MNQSLSSKQSRVSPLLISTSQVRLKKSVCVSVEHHHVSFTSITIALWQDEIAKSQNPKLETQSPSERRSDLLLYRCTPKDPVCRASKHFHCKMKVCFWYIYFQRDMSVVPRRLVAGEDHSLDQPDKELKVKPKGGSACTSFQDLRDLGREDVIISHCVSCTTHLCFTIDENLATRGKTVGAPSVPRNE